MVDLAKAETPRGALSYHIERAELQNMLLHIEALALGHPSLFYQGFATLNFNSQLYRNVIWLNKPSNIN